MLNFTHRPLLVFAAGFLLLACVSLNLHAQDQPSGGTPRRPRPEPTPTQPSTPNKRGNILGGIRQGPKVQFVEGIRGAIRWKKEYGLPSTDGGQTPNKALNCTAFRVTVTVQEGAPGTFGQATSVGYWTVQNEPSEENGYYVCRYSISNPSTLPRNRVITVSSFLGPFASEELNQALITGGWFGDGQPKPPSGYQRVAVGGRGVTLTDAEPRATVDFEMEYRPVPSSPR